MNQDQVPLNSATPNLAVPREVRVIPDHPRANSLPMIERAGSANALVWPGVGAHLRSMNRISLQSGGRTVPLSHPMEAVYYVITGLVDVEDLDAETSQQVGQGGMFLVDPRTRYRINSAMDGAELVGGPCPADPQLYNGLSGT